MTIELIDKILLIALILVTLPLIIIILIQQGKGADMGAAFGSGSANTLFGNTGTSGFLVRFTTYLAIAFFLISFGLAHIANQKASGTLGYGVPDKVPENIVTEFEAIPSGEISDSQTGDLATPEASDVPDILEDDQN